MARILDEFSRYRPGSLLGYRATEISEKILDDFSRICQSGSIQFQVSIQFQNSSEKSHSVLNTWWIVAVLDFQTFCYRPETPSLHKRRVFKFNMQAVYNSDSYKYFVFSRVSAIACLNILNRNQLLVLSSFQLICSCTALCFALSSLISFPCLI